MTEERLREIELFIEETGFDVSHVKELIAEVRQIQSENECVHSWSKLADDKLNAAESCIRRQKEENQFLRELLRSIYPQVDDLMAKRIDAALEKK